MSLYHLLFKRSWRVSLSFNNGVTHEYKLKGNMKMTIRRGDIFYADLSPVIGSEQGGLRPVLIIQNDTGNKHSPTVIVAAITSKMNKAKLPTHIELNSDEYDISSTHRPFPKYTFLFLTSEATKHHRFFF